MNADDSRGHTNPPCNLSYGSRFEIELELRLNLRFESVAGVSLPGSETLRREFARRSLEWGCSLRADDFVITNGCTEAVALALRAVCQPGDTIAVESPTYFGLARTIRELGFQAIPIPVDNSTGIDIDALHQVIKRRKIAACVLIPNFHNPVGFLMPGDRKKELALMMSGRGIPIIEDDIYGDLQHQGARPRCLKAFDREDSVILCGSVSKTLAPGYRVGYVAAGQWHTKVLRLKQTLSLANATLPSLTIAEFLRNGGYDRYLRTIRGTYRAQVERMREAVAKHFPDGVGLSRPAGNFVLWCELPPRPRRWDQPRAGSHVLARRWISKFHPIELRTAVDAQNRTLRGDHWKAGPTTRDKLTGHRELMNKVQLAHVPSEERTSPKGKFHVLQRNVSLALGGQKDVGPWGGGHPFDVAEVTVPPGKTNWPFHYHSAQWEFFIVREGRGIIRTGDGEEEIVAGDAFMRKPGEPHQIRNNGEQNLVLLVIADNPPCDVVGYPGTGQWFVKPARKLLSGEEREFYSGEE